MPHFSWMFGLSCLALGTIACGSPAPPPDTPTQVSPAPEPSQSSQGAASAQPTQSDSAQANPPEMVLDLRVLPHDIAAQDVTSPLERQTITEQVYGEDRSNLLTVMGPVSGSFTAAGQQEMLYLLLPAGRQAASPEPAVAPILAVFAGGELQGQVALRPRQQSVIAAVVDSNGDGIDEILMRSDFFQMGISGATLDLILIADYQEIQLAAYESAFVNSCDNPTGGGDIRAITLQLTQTPDGERALSTERYVAPCNPAGDPSPEAFEPALGLEPESLSFTLGLR